MNVEITGIYGIGISACATGAAGPYNNQFLNNHIHDLPPDSDSGISYGIIVGTGTEAGADAYNNVISQNKIYNVHGNALSLTADVLGTATQYNELVTENMLGPTTALDAIQCYYNFFDSEISNNIIVDPFRTGIRLDGGQRNLITNNIIREGPDSANFVGISVYARDDLDAGSNIIEGNSIFKSSGAKMGIQIEGTSGKSIYYNKVSDNWIYYDGNSQDQGMIQIIYAPYTEVTNNYLYRPRAHGIRIENSTNVIIDDNTIVQSGWSVGVQGHGIYFAGSTAVWGTAQGNNLINPGAGNKGDQDGIHIDGSYVTARENYIFDWSSPVLFRYAIGEAVGSNSNDITGNTIDHRTAALLINIVGGATTVSRNEGFVTENTVALSSVSNGTYVAHGLAGTPDFVTITPSVQAYCWYGTLNSTHVQVYASVATVNGTLSCVYEP